jgi:hypothetical protein
VETDVQEESRVCEQIGIYNFEDGDGNMDEHLTKDELGEVPIPRPITRKRAIARQDPMRQYATDHQLQHNRWCHKSGLRRTIRFQGVQGLPKTYKELMNRKFICESCLKAKMTKCIHPPVFWRQWKIGQLMHADLHMKPIRSWNGKRYSLMCVEHVLKYCMVYFLAHKSDAFEFILIFITWLQRRTGNKLLAVQADGGGEFTGELYIWCGRKGITFQKTS